MTAKRICPMVTDIHIQEVVHQGLMGKQEGHEEMSRLELAEELEKLAEKLRHGKVRLGDRECPVPERLEAEIKLKEKKGYVGVKVRFRFPTFAEEKAAEEWRRRLSFGGVKKKLGEVFGDLLRSASLAAFPEESRMQEYLELSREFAEQADPAWGAEVQEYLDHAGNLHRAFQNRQLEMFRHELRDLQNRMNACHRKFK